MPWKIIKKPNGRYKVKSMESGKIIAKDTTLTNAKKQIRFLGMLEGKKKGK
tara:strand:+ start:434 stop:586 length:153 start_codon:yes stop_codon:yes gene_type:complete